jgi:hypothetical protein
VVVFGTITSIVAGIIWLWQSVARKLKSVKRIRWAILRVVAKYMLLLLWCLLVTSFLVRMTYQVDLGLEVLGYGSAAIAGSMVLMVTTIVIVAI